MYLAARSCLTALTLAVTVGAACAADGTSTQSDPQAWEGLKARLALGTAIPARPELGPTDAELQKINSVTLMGDYYLSRAWLGSSGGLRATSGVLLGTRGSAWSSPALLERRSAGTTDNNADTGTLPYLGLGYTGWSSKGSLGLSADLGLMGSSRAAGRLGRAGTGSQSLDDTIRDLRFAPTVQLGLSYSF